MGDEYQGMEKKDIVFLSWFHADAYCYVFSLQAGAVMSVLIIGALTLTSFLQIMYFLVISSSFVNYVAPFCISYAYLIILSIGLVLIFCGSFTENITHLLVGSAFIFVAIVFYLIISILSFIPATIDIVCLASRCPEHLWLLQSYWRVTDPRSNVPFKEEMPRQVVRLQQVTTEESNIDEYQPIYENTFVEYPQQMRRWADRLPQTIRDIERFRPTTSFQTTEITQSSIPTVITTTTPEYYIGEYSDTRREESTFYAQKQDSKLFMTSDPEEYVERSEDSSTPENYIFSLIMMCLFMILYLGFLCYSLYGFLAYANELDQEDYESF